MKKPRLKWKTRNGVVVALALAHRYVWPLLAIVGPVFVCGIYLFLGMGIGMLALAAYTYVGYRLRWKHIFCSYQNAYRKEMTPDHIRWGMIRKSDVYGPVIIFGVLGLASVIFHFVFFQYI